MELQYVLLLLPKFSVEGSVINRFHQVFNLNVLSVVEVGDRSRQAENLVVRSGGKPHVVNCRRHDAAAFLVQRAELPNLSGGQLGIVQDFTMRISLGLNGVRHDDFFSQTGAGLRFLS